jgi:hypothetical protein
MFKAIFWVAVLGILIFLTVKLLPAYIDNFQFQDDLNNLARVITYAQGKTEADVRSEVLRIAKERGIPVQPEQVTVQRTQVGVSIDVKYNVVIPVPGYTFNLKFNPSAGNKMITAQ